MEYDSSPSNCVCQCNSLYAILKLLGKRMMVMTGNSTPGIKNKANGKKDNQKGIKKESKKKQNCIPLLQMQSDYKCILCPCAFRPQMYTLATHTHLQAEPHVLRQIKNSTSLGILTFHYKWTEPVLPLHYKWTEPVLWTYVASVYQRGTKSHNSAD